MPHPYCTFDDVKDEFPHIDDTEWGIGSTPPQAWVEKRIAEHDGIVDGYLEERFAVPFDPVPPMIAQISRDLTTARVWARMTAQVAEPDNEGPMLHKAAMKLLQDIKTGAVALDAAGVPQADTVAGDDRRPIASWEGDTDASTAEFTRDRTW